MQHRYVADIGDYLKLSILRTLFPDVRLGVAWWIFPDEEHNADGGHREYLKREEDWKHFDPPLFEALLSIDEKKERDIRAIEKADILPGAVFASDTVPCEVHPFSRRPEERQEWLQRVKGKLKSCKAIFLDPDNGIGPERLKLTQRRAGKSVTIAEINEFQENHRTIVVYHHQSRYLGGHTTEIHNLTARLTNGGLHVAGVLRAKPWSPRLFLIINADEKIQTRAKCLADQWGEWICWYPIEEISKILI